MKKILIVGSGFAGSVLAREIAEKTNLKIDIIDKRNHVAGNCHTYLDKNNIMIHAYGPHIFHTSNEKIWKYVNKFGKFNNYVNRVKIINSKGIFSMPINLHTINQYFKRSFSPREARLFLKSHATKIKNVKNFEDKAISLVGKELYKDFLYGYTIKQWGISPKKIPESILKRLPIRFNYNDNYYNDIYQGIPINGYTSLIDNILKHNSINVKLSLDFKKVNVKNYSKIFYTGPIDEFFKYKYGRLNYRTVYWRKKTYKVEDFQGNAVINYNNVRIPYTRVIEFKHFEPQKKSSKTVVFYEYSKRTEINDTPYYPVKFDDDKKKLALYQKDAAKIKNIFFLGRLGTYRYLDMHHVIEESLDFFKRNKKLFLK
jgi:UDP-galactopyranose mutase